MSLEDTILATITKLADDIAEIKSTTANLDESLKGLQELTDDNHRELLEAIRDSIDTGSGLDIVKFDDLDDD